MVASPTNYGTKPDQYTFTILDGDTESNTVDIFGSTITAVSIPAGFGQTTITFQAAREIDTTYIDVYKAEDNTQLSVTVDATEARTYSMGELIKSLYPYQHIKIVAGGAVSGDKELIAFVNII